MKQRIFSFSCVAFATASLAWPMAVFGQTPAAAPDTGAASSSPSIPAELSVEARARYETQMKTLRKQVDAAKWQEALATAEAMNKERPREPQARFLKTIALTELGRGNEAERELLTLVADYPELPEPHNNLATLYAKRGEYDSARRELELALTAVPDYGIAHANLADLYLQQATEHYRRAAALTKNSKDSKALQTRADSIQTLLAPETKAVTQDDKAAALPQGADAAKDEKDAAKDTDKDGDFLSIGCEAPSASDGKDDDDVFSKNGTCDIDFDEPAPEKKEREGGKGESGGKGEKGEKNEKAQVPASAAKP